MESSGALSQLAATHGCTEEVARKVITGFLAALNEVSYKAGATAPAVQLAHAQLGGLAAWHLMGLVVDAADRGNPGALVAAYSRFDGGAAQYDVIAQRWDKEKAAAEKAQPT
jgi:hypothetical protein